MFIDVFVAEDLEDLEAFPSSYPGSTCSHAHTLANPIWNRWPPQARRWLLPFWYTSLECSVKTQISAHFSEMPPHLATIFVDSTRVRSLDLFGTDFWGLISTILWSQGRWAVVQAERKINAESMLGRLKWSQYNQVPYRIICYYLMVYPYPHSSPISMYFQSIRR